ncbi:MAG: hypothetical protein ACE5HC_03785 [Candidatus Binatia bacterium]
MNFEHPSKVRMLCAAVLAVFVAVILFGQTVLAGPTVTVYKTPT